jgi:hypothetical protein
VAEGNGIKFQIQTPPEDQKGRSKNQKTKRQAKVDQILTAKDLTDEDYEEFSLKKETGKTATEENLQVEKRFWPRPTSSRRTSSRSLNTTKNPSATLPP